MLVNFQAIAESAQGFAGADPFDHCVVDDFLLPEVAEALAAEFPSPEADCWYRYDNPIEVKMAANNWNAFPPATYRLFSFLNSAGFVAQLSQLLGVADLSGDQGLNGGGCHSHGRGGKLNPHLDYNLHPKLGLQRKINLIVYLNKDWQSHWGGQLGLWRQDPDARAPGELVTTVEPLFNRAIIFDTTQDSWHGLVRELDPPPGRYRNSLAVYYLRPAPGDAEERGKALYAPTADQAGDQSILDLIERRAQTALAGEVYRR